MAEIWTKSEHGGGISPDFGESGTGPLMVELKFRSHQLSGGYSSLPKYGRENWTYEALGVEYPAPPEKNSGSAIFPEFDWVVSHPEP